MKKILVVFILLFVAGGWSAFTDTSSANHDVSVTISSVVLMELNNTGAISLTTVSPGAGNAGSAVTGETNATKRLYYTSIVSDGTTRLINAKLDAALTVAGVALRLEATTDGGTNEGSGGVQRILTTSDQSIVTDIGSCASGNGGSDGALLTYTLVITDITALEVSDTDTVNVTLTLSDAS